MRVFGEERVVGGDIRAIKNMSTGAKIRVRTLTGDTEFFLIDIGLHCGLALSLFLFTIIMDELTR